MLCVSANTIRPKPIKNCPRIFKLILERGMDNDPNKRPSMQLIFDIMKYLDNSFNKTPVKPLIENNEDEVVEDSIEVNENHDTIQTSREPAMIKTESHHNSSFLRSESKNSINKSQQNLIEDSYDHFKRDIPTRSTLNYSQSKILGHKRSKSYGNDYKNVVKVLEDEKDKLRLEINSHIETMLYDPLEPIDENKKSREIYDEHLKTIEIDNELQRKIAKLKAQKDQLEQAAQNIRLYNELMRQKSSLIIEITRLRNLENQTRRHN
ncbi:unnamed protein product [Brachionus calyciflorus]|uniref:Uncharacterized protein n=1 Tax=Brachionus calyciflorus TaxID=104777 RepID=A0A814J267_9BILA|nr:unnamed protein product [Brachionus calyciflorus]